MEKEFIPYEQALALKELGFDEPCFKAYTEEYKTLISFSNTHTNSSVKGTSPAKPFTTPLYQQAFRWFREKYNINVNLTNDGYITLDMKNNKSYIDKANSYEEAELECLKKLIEIVKQK